jgi:ribonuclease D
LTRNPRRRARTAPDATLLTSQEQFDSLCDRLEQAELVAFDTEFVSESSYRPKLCLLQIATDAECVAVDPFEIDDLSRWWRIMGNQKTRIIIHGGREEVRFCLHFLGAPPRNVIDVQIAEGLLSRGYPLGYSHLVKRVLDRHVHGKHTRTDWARRPLSSDQVAYALEDVEHLPDVWAQQMKSLEELGRLDWAVTESERFVQQLSDAPPAGDWRRINGSSRLARREMAVLQALFQWRDQEAEKRDRPARTVFRDDLLVEVAKLQPETADELHHVRGLERRDYRRATDQILEAVRRGQETPDSELPEKSEPNRSLPDTEALGKLLSMALANRCAELSVSTGLVGTSADLQDLIRWHVFERQAGQPPKLMQGWREEVCGDLLADLMDGKITLRVTNPTSDHPLTFERYSSDKGDARVRPRKAERSKKS